MRVRVRADFKKRITDGRLHQGLSPLEEYFVIGIDWSDYRVIDDEGEPMLYPKQLFEVIEDFFGSDGDKAAQAEARRVLREVLESTLTTGTDEDKKLIKRDLARMSAAVAIREGKR